MGSGSILLALALLAALGARAEPFDPERVAELIVDEANAFRREHRLAALDTNARLARTAHDFAQFLARTDKFGHEADGKVPAQRARGHGYDYCMVAENIGYQYRSAGFAAITDLSHGFVEGWKNSPSHRKAMLDADATETGAAIAHSARTGRYYAVQMFGRPASKSIRFAVANETDRLVEYRVGTERFPLSSRSVRTHELCAPAAIRFESESQTPTNGDRFAVVAERGALRLRRLGAADR